MALDILVRTSNARCFCRYVIARSSDGLHGDRADGCDRNDDLHGGDRAGEWNL